MKRRRGAKVTAASAGLVLVSGIGIAAFAAPGHRVPAMAPAAHEAGASVKRARVNVPTVPLQVVSTSPASGSQAANGGAPVTVTFSAPLAANTPMPALSPKIPGTWRVHGNAVVFTPAKGYPPRTKVTLTIPGGASGMQADGASASAVPGAGLLADSVTAHYTTGLFSTLRLQQLLAELGYLPLTWTASGAEPAATNAQGQLAAAYAPPAGTFTWQSGYPSILRTFWERGHSNLITTGAVRAFEYDQGLTMDGVAGQTVWRHLLSAVAKGTSNPHGYTYALASKSNPETLTIWHNGHVVLHSLANTGIPAAPTADGTFPVYLRYYYQIMKGTNPDGSKYADPVYYVAYFNGGDAVHYFPRYSFGYPQSLGCVELPWDAAKKAWPYLTYGSLVTVEG